MPIRFRCAYCNQLMGIALRKAGTVVTCPKCGGQVVVPAPEEESAAQPQPAGTAFEEDEDVKRLLDFVEEAKPSPVAHPQPAAAAAPRGGPGAYVAPRLPAAPDSEVDVEPFENLSSSGWHLTPSMLALALVVAGLLLGLMFLLGFLLGRSTA